MTAPDTRELPPFDREFFGANQTFTRIGVGDIGGKAAGLLDVRQQVLAQLDPAEFPQFEVVVPTLTVLGADLFDTYLAHNTLVPVALSDQPDDRIAHAFQRAVLPAQYLGDLRALAVQVQRPLAVRSSSLLEDALDHPFAGVYATKMIPNNEVDIDSRFQRLVEAIKFVYASTFFHQAKSYAESIAKEITDEKMAVIIQEVVGERYDERFYPHISGVARSYNYYPTGHARPEDGVVSLALGLGKQIVDGGMCWSYSPAYPQAPPPYGNVGECLRNSQTEFWAVNMGRPPLPDPIQETEYLLRLGLTQAEADKNLDMLASTYDVRSDRLRPGLYGKGPRLLNFAPLLQTEVLPFNGLIQRLLAQAEEVTGSPVEIEFALTVKRGQPTAGQGDDTPARFGFLQMRPMVVSDQEVEIQPVELTAGNVLLASENVLGNGTRDDIQDIVFLKPDVFDAGQTMAMAAELEEINRSLVAEERHCILIGFGRWGSSDRWLGVPVEWGQISATRVIVESTLPEMNPDLSQGSHFFHNMLSFRVLYLSLKHMSQYNVDWDWLNQQPTVAETCFAKHVRCKEPLAIRVDGRRGRGVISRV